MFIFTTLAVMCIIGLAVALSYWAGLEQGKLYNQAAAAKKAKKVIHMETIAIDDNKMCRITASNNREI